MADYPNIRIPLKAKVIIHRGEKGDPYDDTILRQEITTWEDELQAAAAAKFAEIQEEVDEIPKFEILVVQTLPTENINTAAIYLLVNSEGQEAGNLYEEWVNPTGTSAGWEKLGSVAADVDLSDYYKKTETYSKEEIDAKIDTFADFLDEINGDVLHEVTGVTIDEYHGQTPEWTVGDVINLSATVTPGNAIDKTVTWSSSDPSVIRIDVAPQDDLVTATVLAEGEATITVKTTRIEFTDSVTVTGVATLWQRIKSGSYTPTIGDIIDEEAEAMADPDNLDTSHRNWRVVHRGTVTDADDNEKTGLILQMTNCLDTLKVWATSGNGSNPQWSTVTVRTFLNSDFLQTLSEGLRDIIGSVKVPYTGNINPDGTTEDTVFIARPTEMQGTSGAGNTPWDYYAEVIPEATNDANANRVFTNSEGVAQVCMTRESSSSREFYSFNRTGATETVQGGNTNTYGVVPCIVIILDEETA